MKKNFLLAGISLGILTYAQQGRVGINTTEPQGTFHVNSGSKTADTDDVMVSDGGFLGIGTTTPTQKLDIRTGGTQSNPVTGFKLVDGNEKDKRVLTSDANGVGTWKDSGELRIPITSLAGTPDPRYSHDKGTHICGNIADEYYHYTKFYIDLPPGKWAVNVAMLMGQNGGNAATTPNNTSIWVRSTFREGEVNGHAPLPTQPYYYQHLVVPPYMEGNYLVSGSLGGAATYGIAQGTVVINNRHNRTMRYYYMAGSPTIKGYSNRNAACLHRFGGRFWSEDSITAYRIHN